MKNILNFSEAFNIGLHAMVVLADKGEKIPIKELAKSISASENHLSKVMQRLSKGGLVSSEKGSSGGFFIIKKPNQIRLIKIYEIIEGKLTISDCMLRKKICNKPYCPMGSLIKEVGNSVYGYLLKTKLNELLESRK